MEHLSLTNELGKTFEVDLYPARRKNKGIIQLATATAVDKRLYSFFATYLSKKNYTVLVAEYYGVGLDTKTLKKERNYPMNNWRLDIKAVSDYIDSTYSDLPHYFIGHSAGFTFLGYLELKKYLSATNLVAINTQNGYLGFAPNFNRKAFLTLYHYLIAPTLTSILGYLPSKKLNLGENIPAKTAQEFSKWCRSKKYMLQYSGKTYFDDYRGKALFVSVEDDEWSKYEAAQDIMSLFSNLQTEELRITTQDFQEKGMNKMGHFGFFNPRSMSYWNEIITWLEKDVTKEAVEVEKQ